MNDFEQFRQTFFEECDELLQRFEDVATTLQPEGNDSETLNELFRAVHSIKAGAGAFKLDRLVVYAHELEDFLDQVRGDLIGLQADGPALIIQSGDVLRELVENAQSGQEAPDGLESVTLEKLRQLNPKKAIEVTPVAVVENAEATRTSYEIYFRPFRSMYETANEPQLLFEALSDLGDINIHIDTSKVVELSKLDPMESYFSWNIELCSDCSVEDITAVFEFVEDDCELTIKAKTISEADAEEIVKSSSVDDKSPDGAQVIVGKSAKPETERAKPQLGSIRVDLEKVDQLVNMVGELVIAQAMALESISSEIGIAQVNQLQALEDLTMRTRQLQEGVMAIRMQPIKALFSRFPRLVRDLSTKLEKDVTLILEGEATEVDKTIIEELSDPLTHMIRNCMDHGIEMPEDRVQAGKKAQGTVRLSAEQRNGRILIRVSDDGRGLDPDKVVARAIQQGLIAEGDELTKEDIEMMIFRPGFSTASAVSDVSGRGVGMDVVRRNIQKLGGRITLDSKKGHGSCFTLALPLTLAVLDGMLVATAGERYVIPLSSIVETVCPAPSQIKQMPDGGQVLSLRGNTIRLVDLCGCMGLSRKGLTEPLRKLAVIVETEFGRQVGIVVDELLGQQQVVIKSLETNYYNIPGVAGSAILGDGRVRLILDVDGLVTMTPKPSLSNFDKGQAIEAENQFQANATRGQSR
ncbi:chemotaxis protein CheA [Hirschia baltica]|uniref:Chemotaxis protein CheA n=1 Tax=Hirschia baltica (strain ATCC 49814 / DSM 5838 / IFAM 1418) TaxID=582402 RepID=C6XM20_HIRBI|nr:chemotaxis protein CheA [Hirschia baltica]ACT59852.1 CheA signal transduction histidine kinase [Hirschia baltica ATCC 49814]